MILNSIQIDLIHEHDLIPGYKIVNTADFHDHDMGNGRKIRPDPSMHPFLRPPTIKGAECRSQLIHYATEWCSRQHRRFAFTVFIGDPYVRFIRWDRAGAVVSEKFNYREDSRPLIQFLWRFTHADDAGRGRDPTVRRAEPDEAKLAEDHLSEWAPKAKRPPVVFTVPDSHGEPREFLGWGSMANAGSLTGRCTRAYPVIDMKTRKRYFLKDTWRAHDLAQEADILQKLQAAGVEHIPPFVCGGDLLDDVTVTDLYVLGEDDSNEKRPTVRGRDGSWRCGRDWSRITQCFHHRFVVDFIGRSLNTFKDSKEMLQVVSDAFTAHKQAFEKCRIIHRDISAGNILIDDNGRGILNDWDLAIHVSDLGKARRHERTGTWQFMSCLLLMNHHTVHTIQDDMESFVHIILYHGLRYFRHNRTEDTLGLIQNIFDYEMANLEGIRKGGDNKRSMFKWGGLDYFGTDFQFASDPLQVWIKGAFGIVQQWLDFVNPSQGDVSQNIMAAAGRPAPPPGSAITATAPPAHLLLKDHDLMAATFSHCLSLAWPSEDPVEDVLPDQREALSNLAKRGHDVAGMDEDGSIEGARKKSKSSASIRGSGLVSGSSHSMSTRTHARRSGRGGRG
ncbi:kinase-like domain-containing protein, partial [Lyophyllum atratum]